MIEKIRIHLENKATSFTDTSRIRVHQSFEMEIQCLRILNESVQARADRKL